MRNRYRGKVKDRKAIKGPGKKEGLREGKLHVFYIPQSFLIALR